MRWAAAAAEAKRRRREPKSKYMRWSWFERSIVSSSTRHYQRRFNDHHEIYTLVTNYVYTKYLFLEAFLDFCTMFSRWVTHGGPEKEWRMKEKLLNRFRVMISEFLCINSAGCWNFSVYCRAHIAKSPCIFHIKSIFYDDKMNIDTVSGRNVSSELASFDLRCFQTATEKPLSPVLAFMLSIE